MAASSRAESSTQQYRNRCKPSPDCECSVRELALSSLLAVLFAFICEVFVCGIQPGQINFLETGTSPGQKCGVDTYRAWAYNGGQGAGSRRRGGNWRTKPQKVLHGCAPSYLGPFLYVADLPSCRGLCSSCSDCPVQPPVHRSIVGSRAFSVAGPQVCNCLPPEVTSAPRLSTFRTQLKTFLFTESYPDIRLI